MNGTNFYQKWYQHLPNTAPTSMRMVLELFSAPCRALVPKWDGPMRSAQCFLEAPCWKCSPGSFFGLRKPAKAMQNSIPQSMLKKYRKLRTTSSENEARISEKLMSKFACSRKYDFAKTVWLLIQSHIFEILMLQIRKSTLGFWSENGTKMLPTLVHKSIENKCETCDPKIH